MYGLKQAALLAYNFFKQNLQPHGYFPIPHTIGLWKYKHRRIEFFLCINEFGVKYYNICNAQHFINTLQRFYNLSIDWMGSHYCGLTLNWNYPAGFVDLTIPNYIRNILNRFEHMSTQPTFTPFPIMYSCKQRQYQREIQTDSSLSLNSTKPKKNTADYWLLIILCTKFR